MCGIVGYFQFRGKVNPDLPHFVGTARDELAHRGPDDAGLYTSEDGLCVLGHQRLSILDLSVNGHQPMSNEDGTLWIVFNGEIYNFADLREELLAKGHSFRSRSDTEVILHLFEERGPELVYDLDGMFAFVIYDVVRRRLFGARDRLGVKPLYYSLSPQRFAFASEPKALLALPDVSRNPRLDELTNYLTFNCAPGPPTLFKDIEKLEPGTLFELGKEGFLGRQRYWVPGERGEVGGEGEEVSDLVSALDNQLRRATEKRMISDVPFGAMLSGGIDSSLTVALMSEALDVPVKTFTIGYPGDETDPGSDLLHARLVARRFGTHHHEIIVSEDEIVKALDDLPALADDPVGAPSVTANLQLANYTKGNGVTVVQVGEGADEIFCGYNTVHRLWRFHERMKTFGRLMSRPLTGWLADVFEPLFEWAGNPSLIGSTDGTVLEHLHRHSRGEHLHWGYGVLFTRTDQKRLYGNRTPAIEAYERLRQRIVEVDRFDERPYLDQVTLIDLLLGLPERLLMRVDKTTMLYGLEARVPFLDPGVLQVAFQVHPKMRAMSPKQFLRMYAEARLPTEILVRPKVGFPTAQRVFLAPGVLSRIRASVLEKRFLHLTGFDRKRVEHFFAVSENRRSQFFYHIWSLYMLSLWFHCWVEGSS